MREAARGAEPLKGGFAPLSGILSRPPVIAHLRHEAIDLLRIARTSGNVFSTSRPFRSVSIQPAFITIPKPFIMTVRRESIRRSSASEVPASKRWRRLSSSGRSAAACADDGLSVRRA